MSQLWKENQTPKSPKLSSLWGNHCPSLISKSTPTIAFLHYYFFSINYSLIITKLISLSPRKLRVDHWELSARLVELVSTYDTTMCSHVHSLITPNGNMHAFFNVIPSSCLSTAYTNTKQKHRLKNDA